MEAQPDSTLPDSTLHEEAGHEAPQKRVLIVGCGALAREILHLIRLNGWQHVTLRCLPAILHNRPQLIADAVRAKVQDGKKAFEQVFVAYGDCGTGGELDKVLAAEGVSRIGGPHCYHFYAGAGPFDAMMEDQLGSFFLTDYLVRHFDTLITKGFGLDRHPELRDEYFRHYRRLVYLAQTDDAELQIKARTAADSLGLEYHYQFSGMGGLGAFLEDASGSR